MEVETDPFEVVYNHRATELKKRRKLLRKLNTEKKKRQYGRNTQDSEEDNERLNKHMFEEDNLWEVLVDGTFDYKKDSESEATEISTVSTAELALRYVNQLPEVPKKALFSESFTEFRFECVLWHWLTWIPFKNSGS